MCYLQLLTAILSRGLVLGLLQDGIHISDFLVLHGDGLLLCLDFLIKLSLSLLPLHTVALTLLLQILDGFLRLEELLTLHLKCTLLLQYSVPIRIILAFDLLKPRTLR